MVVAATVVAAGASASVVEPLFATALLAAAMAAVLVVRALEARIEVPHGEVSSDKRVEVDLVDPVKASLRRVNDISLPLGMQAC
jgi:hypothetical protein